MTSVHPELRQLGSRIKALRAKAEISQERLADLAGVHRTYMSEIERGRKNPTYIVLLKLAAALRVEPGRLFHD